MESTQFNNSDMSVGTTEGQDGAHEYRSTFMEEVSTFTTFKIANFINTYWFPVPVPIGVVGNTLSFFVMMKPNNRKVSTCIYMAAISINDNILMCMCSHEYLVSSLQIHEWNQTECKFLAFGALFAVQNCTYLTLAMTVDKYIAIKWPHRAATYSTARRARMIVVGLYTSVFIYNIPHFFLSSIIGSQCVGYAIQSQITSIYSWFSFVLNGIIPFTLLIYMNFVIVKTVRDSRKSFRDNDRTTGMNARQKTLKSAESQLTIMLLLVTTLFLILLFPAYFRFIYIVVAKRDTPRLYARLLLVAQVTGKLYPTNSGINFFLYCISGKKFRNDLKEIFRCSSTYKSPVTESKSNSTQLNFVQTDTYCSKSL